MMRNLIPSGEVWVTDAFWDDLSVPRNLNDLFLTIKQSYEVQEPDMIGDYGRMNPLKWDRRMNRLKWFLENYRQYAFSPEAEKLGGKVAHREYFDMERGIPIIASIEEYVQEMLFRDMGYYHRHLLLSVCRTPAPPPLDPEKLVMYVHAWSLNGYMQGYYGRRREEDII